MKPTLTRAVRSTAFALVIAALPLVGTSGCLAVAAGAAGAGTVAYIRGELDTSVSHPIDQVDNATNRAAAQLRFVKISEVADALTRVITLRTAEDKKIDVRLNRTSGNLTRVRIRVGIFGDETISRALMNQISADL